jgi:peptidoglycan-associated lipoprotein
MLVWFRENCIRANYDANGQEECSQINKAMKLTKFSNLMVLGLALTLTAVGCRKNPYDPNVIHGQKSAIAGRGPNEDFNNGLNGGQPFKSPRYIDTHPAPPIIPLGAGHLGWAEDHDSLKAQTIYFEYDKSAVRANEQAKIVVVVNYLKTHPDAAVRVEGNCDERGTEEYNRSLGERRALAGREKIVSAGIDASRVDTISYGEDHPVEPLHNEAAWSKNRRDDFTVLTRPH